MSAGRKRLWIPAFAGMTLLLVVTSCPVFASNLTADQPGEISSGQPGEISTTQKGEISASQPGELNTHQTGEITTTPPDIDPVLCHALIKHTPSADVTYQPGVDVAGSAVAPADLPGQTRIQLPDKINIPLTVSLVQALNLNPNAFPANKLGAGTELPLGTLTIDGDQVLLNGQPLTDTQQDNLAVLCLQPTDAAPKP